MKQSTFKTELRQYYDDVDAFIDVLVKMQVDIGLLEYDYEKVMSGIGVANWEDYTDVMFDIIANEEDARNEGREPVRKVFYKFTEFKVDKEAHKDVPPEVWLEYTENDYLYFIYYRTDLQRTLTQSYPYVEKAMQRIVERFGDNTDFITAHCLQILHCLTKADCDDFIQRTRRHIKDRHLDTDVEKFVLDAFCGANCGNAVRTNFLGPLLYDPFTKQIQAIKQEQFKDLEERNPKDFVEYVFGDTRRINNEITSIFTSWYGQPTGKDLTLRQTKLARTKEINALQTLNLARDSKGTRHTSTSNGGLASVQVFENKDVEIITSRIEDVSLSTNTRQLFDFFLFKGIEQITHKGSIEQLYKQRSVTVDLDEVATVFSIDKRDARKRLNAFYDEMRDLKVKIHWHGKDEKGKPKVYKASVNIFDADVQEVDLEEKNATVRPEDVDEGVQITLYNTGTLLNYNPKRKKEPKNAVKLGRLTMQFSMDFARHLSQASVVRHNPKGYLINRKKYKSAYSLQCILENHAYMNRDKRNAGVISLGTILKDCYEIPAYETVTAGNRNYTDRIKKPLLLSVQALKDADVLRDFKYYTQDKRAISEKALLSLNYDDFIKCTLHFKLSPIEE